MWVGFPYNVNDCRDVCLALADTWGCSYYTYSPGSLCFVHKSCTPSNYCGNPSESDDCFTWDSYYLTTLDPTKSPTVSPTAMPTKSPSLGPSFSPSMAPSAYPTSEPTSDPTAEPTSDPTADPTAEPTADPSAQPTSAPTDCENEILDSLCEELAGSGECHHQDQGRRHEMHQLCAKTCGTCFGDGTGVRNTVQPTTAPSFVPSPDP